MSWKTSSIHVVAVTQRQRATEVLSQELILSKRWQGNFTWLIHNCFECLTKVFYDSFKPKGLGPLLPCCFSRSGSPWVAGLVQEAARPIPSLFSLCCWCCDKTPNTRPLVSLHCSTEAWTLVVCKGGCEWLVYLAFVSLPIVTDILRWKCTHSLNVLLSSSRECAHFSIRLDIGVIFNYICINNFY